MVCPGDSVGQPQQPFSASLSGEAIRVGKEKSPSAGPFTHPQATDPEAQLAAPGAPGCLWVSPGADTDLGSKGPRARALSLTKLSPAEGPTLVS